MEAEQRRPEGSKSAGMTRTASEREEVEETEDEETTTKKRAPKRPKSKPVIDDSDVEMGDEGKGIRL